MLFFPHRFDMLVGALMLPALPALRWILAVFGLRQWHTSNSRVWSLRIGAYRCRWADAPQHDWRSWNPERQAGDAEPELAP